MKRKLFLSSLLLLTPVCFSPLVQAHHAFSAEFDAKQPIELKGTISKLELVNPHSWLYFDVVGADGKKSNWGFEFGAPFSLKQKGITKASLPVGTEITIKGYRSKSGLNFGYAVTVNTADGRSFSTGGAPDAPSTQTSSTPTN